MHHVMLVFGSVYPALSSIAFRKQLSGCSMDFPTGPSPAPSSFRETMGGLQQGMGVCGQPYGGGASLQETADLSQQQRPGVCIFGIKIPLENKSIWACEVQFKLKSVWIRITQVKIFTCMTKDDGIKLYAQREPTKAQNCWLDKTMQHPSFLLIPGWNS